MIRLEKCRPAKELGQSARIASAFLLFAIPAAGVWWGSGLNAQDEKPELHYLVVDMSGSIETNGFRRSVVGAVTQFVGRLPQNSVLKIQLFDHRIDPNWKREWGPNLGANAIGDITEWFNQNYRPSGDTFLFDAAAIALEEVKREANQYSTVNVVIISDGINDPEGRPTVHQSWASVSRLAEDLNLSRMAKKEGRVVWLYLGDDSPDLKKPPEPISTIFGKGDEFDIPVLPSADFEGHPLSVKVGGTVALWAKVDAGIETYSWTFSDGQTSTEEKPKVVFNEAGRIGVTLEVVNKAGHRDTDSKDGYIMVVAEAPPPTPSAAFLAVPRVAKPGEDILFTLQSEIGVDRVQWQFGDRTTSDVARITHSYQAPGEYAVTLKASGPGGEDEKNGLIQIVAEPPPPRPLAAFDFSPSQAKPGEPVLFVLESVTGVEKVEWKFGDGSDSEELQPKHAYEKPGEYNVSVKVSGPGGEDEKAEEGAVTVSANLIIARYSVDPAKGIVPLTVEFTDESEGKVAAYDWDFGDGSNSDRKNPSHTYEESGSYQSRLTVTNNEGEKSKSAEEVTITVEPPPPPPPLLWRILKWLLSAVFLWLLLARFVLRPLLSLIGASKNTEYRLRLSTGRSSSMLEVYRLHKFGNLFWPRRVATLGGSHRDDIPLTIQKESVACIRRVPFQRRFELVPGKDTKFTEESVTMRLGKETKTELPVTGRTTLENHQVFFIEGTRVEWEEI